MLQREEQIFAVLWCERGNAQFYSRQVDSFVFAKGAAIYDFADHFGSAHLQHAQFNQSIGKKNAVAAMNFARERLENGAHAGGITEHARGGDHKFLAGAQNYRRTAGEPAGSNPGALQGGEGSDWVAEMDRRTAHDIQNFGVGL